MNRIFTAALFIALATACATPAAKPGPDYAAIRARAGQAFNGPGSVENEEDRGECRDRGLPSNCNSKKQ